VKELIGTASEPHPRARTRQGHSPEALRALRRYLEKTRDILDAEE
jgi:hypothetical protein